MISALGSHRFNPQTGLWELVSLENVAGVEMSLPAVAEVRGVGADGPVTTLPESVTPPPLDDVGVALPHEPEGPDVFVAPETLIVCDPVVPELVEVEEPVDIVIDWGWYPPIPPIPPTIIEMADGLIIIGGPIHSVLEGGDGNDLIIAGASADHPGNQVPPWSLLDCGPNYLSGSVFGDRLRGGLGQDTLIGNDLGNRLEGGAGADVMIGGGGSDVYVVDDAGDRVIEVSQGDYDYVLSSVSYILSDNVENLTLASGAGDINGAGNNLDNLLWGNEGRNILSGGAGNDVLVGGSGDTLIGGQGQDLFVCGSGDSSLVIADFQVGVDRINGLPYEYNDQTGEYFVVAAMRQDGADVFISCEQGEIRLIGVDMRLLSAQDFVVGDFLFFNPGY